MQHHPAPLHRPRVVLESFKPVSIFLCPCHVDSAKIRELESKAVASAAHADRADLLDLYLEPFDEKCIGLVVHIQPRLFFLSGLNWVALALAAELSPQQGGFISFEQMLAFNSNFRVCQGELERQDTPMIGVERLTFALSGGCSASQVFERVARQVLGCYQPPEALKRTVTLSIAQFEHVLSGTDLYLFGTIAHSDEIADPVWAATMVRERAYDRWCPVGIRFFVHSYSLVCSWAAGNVSNQNPRWLFDIFMNDYVRMGARVALERAELVELRSTLQDIGTLAELREQRKNWVNSRRVLGVRWTAEGTQRAQIEHIWRQVSGTEKMSEEIDQRFEQTVDLFEAEAANRLNQLLMWLQMLVAGAAAAGLTAHLTLRLEWNVALAWALGMGILATGLCWVWLHYALRRFRRRRDKPS
jgi:hypothetical protein